jgi:hypothetical protein
MEVKHIRTENSELGGEELELLNLGNHYQRNHGKWLGQ